MLLMTASNLKKLREEVSITQEVFAHQAELKLKTYRSAEWGKNVSYTTASKILSQMNMLRQGKGLDPIVLEDLGLQIV